MKTALFFAAAAIALSAPAYALDKPVDGQADTRIRYINYDPNNIVQLWTAPSGIMEIQFSADERVPAGNVAVADGEAIQRMPRGNFLYLKLKTCIQPQPLLVTTELHDGSLRPYRFEIETRGGNCAAGKPSVSMVSDGGQALPAKGDLELAPVNALAPGADVMYAVVFRYPEQERAKRAEAARAWREQEQQAAVKDLLDRPNTAAAGVIGPGGDLRNYRYIMRGSDSLTPALVWDNADFTAFWFPGNTRVPSIYRINPDGTEASVEFSIHHTQSGGDTVSVSGTSQFWRLRDGKTVAEICNLGFNPAAMAQPWTGTKSRHVRRLLKGNRDGR